MKKTNSNKVGKMYAQIQSLEKRTLLAATPLPDHGISTSAGIWSVDSTGNNLVQLLPAGSSASKTVQYRGLVYFEDGSKIYSTDGTVAGTKKIAGDPSGSGSMAHLVGIADGLLYYSETKYDNSEHESYGHMHVINANGSDTSFAPYASNTGKIRGGKLYVDSNRYVPYSYHAYSVSNGTQLTEIDYHTIPAAVPSDTPPTLESVTIGSRHIYASNDSDHGRELWIDSGSGGHLVQELVAGSGSSSPTMMAVTGSRVIFTASSTSIIERSATIVGGTLFVGGHTAADKITISSSSGITTVRLEIPIRNEILENTFNDSDFTQIQVESFTGDDLVDLSGTSKPATVYADAGNDTIIAGHGNETLDGGDGNDTLDYSQTNQKLTKAAMSKKITSTLGEHLYNAMETLLCGSGDDQIGILSTGGSSNADAIRYIDGGAGNDLLFYSDYGWNGTDPVAPTVHGGTGDDTLSVDRSAGAFKSGGDAFYFGDDGNDTLRMERVLSDRKFHGGAGIDSVSYGTFSTAGALKISLDNQANDGPTGKDNVYDDVEIVDGSPWNDTITGSNHAETLRGGSGDDIIDGGGGDDLLNGGSGDDTLTGAAGADTISGFTGVDQINSDNLDTVTDSQPFLNGKTLNVEGTNGNDVITLRTKPGDSQVIQVLLLSGTFEFDVDDVNAVAVYGFDGDDNISIEAGFPVTVAVSGGAGNDTLASNSDGVDSLRGDAGDDDITGMAGDDSLDGGSGDNSVTFKFSSGSGVLFAEADKDLLQIIGSSGDDEIAVRRNSQSSALFEVLINGVLASFNNQQIQRLTIQALGGNDNVSFGDTFPPVPARIYGGDGNDVLRGTPGADRISGGNGNDWINAGAGDDVIYGDAGNDRLFGDAGRDYLNGGAGSDIIRAGVGKDRIIATVLADDYRGNSGDIVSLLNE